jgi:hypothetical protein
MIGLYRLCLIYLFILGLFMASYVFRKTISIVNYSDSAGADKKTRESDENNKTFNLPKEILYSGVHWKPVDMSDKKASNESGATEQFKVKLVRSGDGGCIETRVKMIDSLNEAIVYHKINKNNDPLNKFMPEYMAVFDKNGKELDLSELLKDNTIPDLCANPDYKPAYIMIRDLVDVMDRNKRVLAEDSLIKDFKFVRPSLQGPKFETRIHGYATPNDLYKFVRRVFFGLSRCSFAFQESTKSKWYTIIITNFKRMMSVIRTKDYLRSEFVRLPVDQLDCVKRKLESLKDRVGKSDYALADSSLLFIPTHVKNGDQIVNGINIHLIDMSHAIAKNEFEPNRIKKYERMKQEMMDSIEELILTKSH